MQSERLHAVPTQTPREILIRVAGVSKSYQRGPETVQVLHGLNLEVREGEFVALMGPSGSGKSTLLNLLGGIDRPTSGSIRVAGMDIDKLSESELAKWRGRHVGFVFQMYHLVSVMTAERNVELPLVLTDMGRAEREKRVRAALSLVGLADRAKHKPAELSGGQEQRVAIARAIVHSPELLLCDEPTGDLDATTGESILNLLKALNTEYGKTIIMVTHDQRAAAYARRTLHVSKGRLAVESGA